MGEILVLYWVFPLPAGRRQNEPRSAQGAWDSLRQSCDVALEPAGLRGLGALKSASLNLLLLGFRKVFPGVQNGVFYKYLSKG